MYSAKFKNENGNTFLFSYENNIVFDIDGLSGIDIGHTLSQAAGQIGQSISTKSINGRTLTIKGKIFRDFTMTKNKMRSILTPLTEGQLIFNSKYYIDVSVKKAPTFSPLADDGSFSLQLLAPYPFFKKVNETSKNIGGITKLFRFPVNYSTPHTFGTRSGALYANVYNSGDLETDFKVTFTTNSLSKNPTISNLTTFEVLKINRTLTEGEKISVYRKNGILNVVLADSNGSETNIFSDLDEDSSLFELHQGDNIIARSDDAGGQNLIVDITFNEPVTGVYDEA